jgi:hypothetical protein
MLSKKTTKTLAKWPNGVFEEFIASGMKLEDLLDEDIKPNIIRGIRSAGDFYHVTTGDTKEDRPNASVKHETTPSPASCC